ncbi:hypothetical protein G6F22_009173 [Rhizopus arrhizus]|nr:hypothetical protein G6F23_008121 [Rhizopus arrhizus]KAG0782286.1 hypothetical protein G6F22_009173 [Rhizopus arrhizus]
MEEVLLILKIPVLELCRCLMKKDFNIELDFPLDRLCPAIPNRLNYILWLEDLLSETMETTTKAKGIDIGVGASCIYPLLACACHPHWSFLGTEIDTRSMDYARKNIERNHLEDRIQLIYNKDPDKIFPLDDEKETFDFCMCNPPFYESKEALEEGMTNKELEPYAVCTGSSNEMITTGGEYGFISKMINESVRLGTRIRWYTSMLGMKKSIGPLIRLIKQAKITNYLVTELTQGKTTRWVIAWSFYSERAFKTYSLEEYHPKCQFVVNLPKSPQFVIDQMECILKDLEIDYEKKQDDETITSTVRKNTWSRAARRQKRQKIIHEEEKREDLFTFVLEWIEDSENEFSGLM